MKAFYAIVWTYGRAVDMTTCNRDGKHPRCGEYVWFDTRAARDEFLEGGPERSSQSGYREAIPANDPELRSLLRDEAGRREITNGRTGKGR